MDAGTYGIASNQDEYNTCSEDVYVEDDGGHSPTAYVSKTNSGDGAFVVFTNLRNTAFFLDDEDIYLNHLIEELCPDDASNVKGAIDGFRWEPDDSQIITYFHGLDVSAYTIQTGEGGRNKRVPRTNSHLKRLRCKDLHKSICAMKVSTT